MVSYTYSMIYFDHFYVIYLLDSLLNLDTLIIQLREISSKWESLGEHLNFSASILLQIKNIANGSDFNCLVELCDKWLRDVYNPTWKMVADVLILIGEEKLSSELLHIYDTGMCILLVV